MFGDSECNSKKWPIIKMERLFNVSSSKRIYQEELTDYGVPFLRISDLVNKIDGKNIIPSLFITKEFYDDLLKNKQVPQENDILVTSRGTLGNCYIIKGEDQFYFQDGMISWLSKRENNIDSMYISHLFSMQGIKNQIKSIQSGTTVAYLSISMIKKLDIMTPPIELQNKFAAIVEQIDKSKYILQKQIDALQELLDSKMEEFFG